MYDPVILFNMTYECIEDKDAYLNYLFRSIHFDCMGKLPLFSSPESEVAWISSEHDEGIDFKEPLLTAAERVFEFFFTIGKFSTL